MVIANHRITTVQTTQTKTNQADTNFEYEDNEWDIGLLPLKLDRFSYLLICTYLKELAI